ncbi:hypothetical protein Tco_0511415 [Tanacetum coccineum]
MASDNSDQDARYALSKLLQRGTVAEYESEFLMLIKRVTGISESLLKSFYISELKPLLECALLRKKLNIEEKINIVISWPSEEAPPVIIGSLDANEDIDVVEVSSAIDVGILDLMRQNGLNDSPQLVSEQVALDLGSTRRSIEDFVSFREMITSQLQGKLWLYDEVQPGGSRSRINKVRKSNKVRSDATHGLFLDHVLVLVLPELQQFGDDLVTVIVSQKARDDHYIEPTEFEIQEMLIMSGDIVKDSNSYLKSNGSIEDFVSFREMIASQLQGKLWLYDEVHDVFDIGESNVESMKVRSEFSEFLENKESMEEVVVGGGEACGVGEDELNRVISTLKDGGGEFDGRLDEINLNLSEELADNGVSPIPTSLAAHESPRVRQLWERIGIGDAQGLKDNGRNHKFVQPNVWGWMSDSQSTYFSYHLEGKVVEGGRGKKVLVAVAEGRRTTGVKDGTVVALASFHFQGEALSWYKGMHNNLLLGDWTSFTRAFELRFGSSSFENHQATLFKLK